jgi:hypothetical protein
LSDLPKSSFGRGKVYPSQTKILEGLTKEEIRNFEALFKGVSTRFGLLTIEKYIENLDFIFCQSFQTLRLGSIKLIRKIETPSWDETPPTLQTVMICVIVASKKVALSRLG